MNEKCPECGMPLMAPDRFTMPSGAPLDVYTCVDPVCGSMVFQTDESCTDYDLRSIVEVMEPDRPGGYEDISL